MRLLARALMLIGSLHYDLLLDMSFPQGMFAL